MNRCYGHIPDSKDVECESSDHVVGIHGELPSSASLVQYIPSICNQGSTGTCVGQAIARAVDICGRRDGLALPYPSVLGIYALAREYEGQSELLDLGCRPYFAMSAVSKSGLWAEHDWPFDINNLNTRVPFDLLAKGYGARLSGYYKVIGDDQDRCWRIRQAISQGFPVVFAMNVDDLYESGKFDSYDAMHGRKDGSHMQCIVGYKPGFFHICNSWGSSWGHDGYAWVSDQWLGSGNCFDFYTITIAPKIDE